MPPRMAGSGDRDETVAPAVLGADYLDPEENREGSRETWERTEGRPSFPPVVYVPCEAASPNNGELSVDLRRTRDGRTALLVYSSNERLVRCCGEQQPWVAVHTEKLDELDRSIHFDLILLDVEIPQEFRR
ncbi:SseB protein N-terminal domain-containing protein [Actinopolyspora lacussalsi subsp. righensis]|uniref:SseB protein N-terminal domain-containing protein n=1 Tax=Actinopolyspora righensis TaxID=995060 RepID=A0A1I7CBI3_9ACTN|nr:SseB protein N-terminal domain-containing protein [Actinopolyspora righensis]